MVVPWGEKGAAGCEDIGGANDIFEVDPYPPGFLQQPLFLIFSKKLKDIRFSDCGVFFYPGNLGGGLLLLPSKLFCYCLRRLPFKSILGEVTKTCKGLDVK